MTQDQIFGARLRALRKARGLSQSDIAKAAGITWQQTQKHECGANRISCSTLMLYCEALKIHPAAFFVEPAKGCSADYIAGYEQGARDGKAEGLAEGISRALARIRPSIVELEKQVYEIGPDDPPGDVIALKTYR